MTSTTETLRAVDRTVSDPVTEAWRNAAEITGFALDAYVTGLNTLVDQQQAVQRASERWLDGIINPGSQGRHEAGAETRAAVESPTGSARAASSAGQTAARKAGRTGSTRRASAQKRNSTATARRRAVTPTAKSALADAVGPALARWTPEGYDTLNASEVIEKLPQFSQVELREVETYEKANQARVTILQRIDTLRGDEPVPGYDELTVPEIESRLAKGDAGLAARARDYERSHKARAGVLQATDAHVG
jgi:hypothetical protein